MTKIILILFTALTFFSCMQGKIKSVEEMVSPNDTTCLKEIKNAKTDLFNNKFVYCHYVGNIIWQSLRAQKEMDSLLKLHNIKYQDESSLCIFMKNNILIIIATFFITNCNIRQVDNKAVAQSIDSVRKDTALQRVNRIFNDPYRDINNFDFKVGNEFIDNLHTEYSKTAELTLVRNICVGDNCESYQTFSNKDNHTILYFFKGDGSEYGFSNDQCLLQNDSLKFIRNFNVNIETWPTDSTETIWRVEETTYKFETQVVSCIRKTTLTKDLDKFDFTLKKVTSGIIKVNWKETYQDKAEELKKLLALKDSENRD